MILSDEQMLAVRHGSTPPKTPYWYEAVLPAGPQPIPEWANGLWIEWLDGYGNSPNYVLRGRSNLRDWPNKRFLREGTRFMAVSDDGRAEIYYQGGPMSLAKVKRYRTADGALHVYPPTENYRAVPGEWIEVETLCTRQEQGFAGSHVAITMVDGTEVTLRGPWHGGAPLGFVETAYVNMDSDCYRNHQRYRKAYSRGRERKSYWDSWGTATGGLYISDELFKRLFARFQPHLRLAWVSNGWGGERLEAMKADWSAPKAWETGLHKTERQP